MLKLLFNTLYISLLYAANYVEKWDTKRWEIYHRKDALKQLSSSIHTLPCRYVWTSNNQRKKIKT